ncbi:MAG: methyltransferase domain-containing protein [Planctomycetota bacterium]
MSDPNPQTNASMSEPSTSKLYDVWAKVYDHTFGALVHKRQRRALKQLRHEPGDRVLDLGVGTGMTLEHYPRDMQVVGMDLSPGMLAKAQQKVDEQGLDHVQLLLGNALETPFADHSFDHVVISHTISVVSEPNKLLREAKRLVKPDGRIIVLNHFRSYAPMISWFERITNPIFVKIGWRSDLRLEECLEGVGLRVLYHFKLSTVDFWQIVVLTPRMRSLTPAA